MIRSREMMVESKVTMVESRVMMVGGEEDDGRIKRDDGRIKGEDGRIEEDSSAEATHLNSMAYSKALVPQATYARAATIHCPGSWAARNGMMRTVRKMATHVT